MPIDLTAVGVAARDYANAHLACDRPRQKELLAVVAGYGAVEMAHFCQQVVSYIPTVAAASMCLTILTNRLVELTSAPRSA